MGKEIEAQQAAAPSIALMRAQLAGQKYTLQNDAKALNIIADNLGIEPQNTQQALMKGDLTPTQIAKIPQLYPIIATLSPSRAEMLKNMHGMLVESNKVGAEIGKGTMDAVKIVLETPGALPLLPKMFTQGIPGQAAQTTQTVPQGLGFNHLRFVLIHVITFIRVITVIVVLIGIICIFLVSIVITFLVIQILLVITFSIAHVTATTAW